MFWGAFTLINSIIGSAKNDVDIYKRNKEAKQRAIEKGEKYYSDVNGQAIRTKDDAIVGFIYEDGAVWEINPRNGKKIRDITSDEKISYATNNIQKALNEGKTWVKVYKYTKGRGMKYDRDLYEDGLTGHGDNPWREKFRSAYIIGDRWYRIENGKIINVPYVIRNIRGSIYFLNCKTLRYDYYSNEKEKQNRTHTLFHLEDMGLYKEKYVAMPSITSEMPTDLQMKNNLKVLNAVQDCKERTCIHCDHCMKGMPGRKINTLGYGTSCPCKDCNLFNNEATDCISEKRDFVTMN